MSQFAGRFRCSRVCTSALYVRIRSVNCLSAAHFIFLAIAVDCVHMMIELVEPITCETIQN